MGENGVTCNGVLGDGLATENLEGFESFSVTCGKDEARMRVRGGKIVGRGDKKV